MSPHMLSDNLQSMARDIQPRAAELRHLTEAYMNAATRLEVLATFLQAGRGQPNMLYALALTDEIYLTLTGCHLPVDDETGQHRKF